MTTKSIETKNGPPSLNEAARYGTSESCACIGSSCFYLELFILSGECHRSRVTLKRCAEMRSRRWRDVIPSGTEGWGGGGGGRDLLARPARPHRSLAHARDDRRVSSKGDRFSAQP